MKVGDRIVCIDIDSLDEINITVGGIYCIVKCDSNWIYIINNIGHYYGYHNYRFVSIKEYRRLKLNKIEKRSDEK